MGGQKVNAIGNGEQQDVVALWEGGRGEGEVLRVGGE